MLPPSASASPSRDMTTTRLVQAAISRQYVTLPDGAIGTLVFVSPTSHVAKVKIGSRHVRISADQLTINYK